METDPEGNPQYPPLGMPESRYSPEGQDFSRKTSLMEEVLSTTQEILIKFLISLSPPEQIILSQEAQSAFLKNPEALKAHYCVPSQDDDEEQEETNTVVPPHVENPEDTQDVEENIQERDEVRSNHLSPQISLASSKTTKLKGRSYQARKMRINNLPYVIETNFPSNHSEHLKEQASLLSSML